MPKEIYDQLVKILLDWSKGVKEKHIYYKIKEIHAKKHLNNKNKNHSKFKITIIN